MPDHGDAYSDDCRKTTGYQKPYLPIHVVNLEGKVVMTFHKPANCVALSPDLARDLILQLRISADEVEGKGDTSDASQYHRTTP